jgi:hypothetical protein
MSDQKGESFYAVVRVEDIATGINGIIGCFQHEHFAKLVLGVARDLLPHAGCLYVISGSQMLKMLGVDQARAGLGWFDFTLDNSVGKLVAEIGKRVTEPLSPDVAFTAESEQHTEPHPDPLCPPASADGRQDQNISEEE